MEIVKQLLLGLRKNLRRLVGHDPVDSVLRQIGRYHVQLMTPYYGIHQPLGRYYRYTLGRRAVQQFR